MKYGRLITLGALGAMPFLAHAQSSVTLYGVIDESLGYTSNEGGGHVWGMSGGVLQGSRWGFRGTEDLGGGWATIFTLENGFDATNGSAQQGGLLFGRRAFVGLSNERFGSVTLGRQYDEVVDYPGPFADRGLGGGYIASHPGDIDNFNNAYRTNNAIKYESANYGGFHFGGLYSLGGVPGDTGRNQVWSLGAGYQGGALAFGVGYLNVRNPNVSFFGNSTTGTPSVGNANVSSPVYSGFTSARTYQVIGAGAAYRFGAATLGATWSNIQFLGLGDTAESGPNPSGYTGSARFNNGEVNLQYRITPALTVTAAYDYMRGSSVSSSSGVNGGATYNQGTLSADYALSKRTDVYVIGVYQRASGTDSTDHAAVASIDGLTASKGNSQTAVRFGLRQRF